METLLTLELGSSHFYYMSDVVTFIYDDYLAKTQEERDNICPAFNRFGEPPSEILIATDAKKKYFFGRYRVRVNQYGLVPNRASVRLDDEIRKMFDPFKQYCDIHEGKSKCVIMYPPSLLEDEKFTNFVSYIALTR